MLDIRLLVLCVGLLAGCGLSDADGKLPEPDTGEEVVADEMQRMVPVAGKLGGGGGGAAITPTGRSSPRRSTRRRMVDAWRIAVRAPN